jgi:hypothetical protein
MSGSSAFRATIDARGQSEGLASIKKAGCSLERRPFFWLTWLVSD